MNSNIDYNLPTIGKAKRESGYVSREPSSNNKRLGFVEEDEKEEIHKLKMETLKFENESAKLELERKKLLLDAATIEYEIRKMELEEKKKNASVEEELKKTKLEYEKKLVENISLKNRMLQCGLSGSMRSTMNAISVSNLSGSYFPVSERGSRELENLNDAAKCNDQQSGCSRSSRESDASQTNDTRRSNDNPSHEQNGVIDSTEL